jgi:hypothetical protein
MAFDTFTACPHCGAAVAVTGLGAHECRPQQRIDHEMRRVRYEIAQIELELARYLETARGKFDAWYAERTRLAD